MEGVVMNSVCHYDLVCCAMLCHALSCCARSLGVSSKGKKNRQIMQWCWAAGQPLFMIAMAASAVVSCGKRTKLREANEADTTAATGIVVLHDDLRLLVRVTCG